MQSQLKNVSTYNISSPNEEIVSIKKSPLTNIDATKIHNLT